MAVALLKEPPLTWTESLGSYRLADYDRLPDEPRCELLFGRFYLSPGPSLLHQLLAFLLGQKLDGIAMRAGGLSISVPVHVVLAPHSVVQPDLVYLSAACSARAGARIEGTPDLVVEILSPGTARRDRGEKLALYAAAGVLEYWIVDPVERQIEFLVCREGRFTVALPSGREYRSQALPEVRLDLEELWSQLEERLVRAGRLGHVG